MSTKVDNADRSGEVPISHKFTYPQLAFDQPINKQPYIRISMFFRKRDDIGYEYFLKRWHHVHADIILAASSWKKCNIHRYVQFYQSPESRRIAGLLTNAGGDAPGLAMDFDACSEFWVDDHNDWVNFTNSEEYNAAVPDSAAFISGVQIMVGYDNVIFGDVAPSSGGKPGILKKDLRSS